MTEKEILEIPNMVWAFNRPSDFEQQVYKSVKEDGKSRFGWSGGDEHNMLLDGWTDRHGKNRFLLQIQQGDWIVHVNTPCQGRCIAAKVISTYGYDEGIETPWGPDFRAFFQIAKESITEFDRNDPNVLPTVTRGLKPRSRYQRIRDTGSFIKSIENLRGGKVRLEEGETKQIHHLKKETKSYLRDITSSIQKMHKSKNLERFFGEVFRRIHGVSHVKENGFGWKSDHGADLIVDVKASIGNMDFENMIVVQIKSYTGDHNDTGIVNDIKKAIEVYKPSGAMMITTANATEGLENEVDKLRSQSGIPIDLIGGEDVAKFVLKHAPDLVFDLNL